jgi:hypothetical protein
MNLFILSDNPAEIALWMMDKHIVKIILEAVQMLSSAYQIIMDDENSIEGIYKITHKNHPVSIWVRESRENFLWVLELCDAMHIEWRHRYNHPETKFHKSYLLAMRIREQCPSAEQFRTVGMTPFVLAMPDIYKTDCPFESYRNYYQSPEKQRIASWKNRTHPKWFKHIGV